jgi:hypothetical protein
VSSDSGYVGVGLKYFSIHLLPLCVCVCVFAEQLGLCRSLQMQQEIDTGVSKFVQLHQGHISNSWNLRHCEHVSHKEALLW